MLTKNTRAVKTAKSATSTAKAVVRKGLKGLAAIPGLGRTVPTSKAEAIRLLANKKDTTAGAIKKALEGAGIKVYHSEIYGAVNRAAETA